MNAKTTPSLTKSTRIALGCSLFAAALACIVWLGHAYPWPAGPATLGEAIQRQTELPELHDILFLLPIAAAAAGLVLAFRDTKGLWWLHLGALVVLGTIWVARMGIF